MLMRKSASPEPGRPVVIKACAHHERLVVHPHTLFVHSYKSPTFCDFCGELLFGLVKQGLKCQGCGLNYHKRCASKIPNNCNGSRQRRPSAIPLSPQNSRRLSNRNSNVGTISSAASHFSHLEVTSQTLGASTSQLAPDIFITPENDCGDPVGGNYLQMPRKDRSCSWSGRPLWMEVAEATRVKVPHTFQVHSYKRPTVCQHCKKLLKGLIRQGMQCRDCKYNCHKKCSSDVARDCPGSSITSSGTPYFLGQESDGCSDFGGSTELLRMNSVPYDTDQTSVSGEESSESTSRASSSHRKAASTPSAPLQSERGTTNYEGGERSPEDEDATTESQNIPLMRVVMSKKQTKRRSAKTLREGWLLHSTDQTSMRKKHYWRLDTKGITLFHDETSNRYYKELPLSEVLDLKLLSPDEQKTHVFEIKTSVVTYFVDAAGHLPTSSSPSPDHRRDVIDGLLDVDGIFGIDSDVIRIVLVVDPGGDPSDEKRGPEGAGTWANAIKSALMPVTPQSSTPLKDQLKVPGGDATKGTHLGVHIQTEHEFSSLYQIFADEILGSGQFGTVYGGIHRKSSRHVAVKLIDKLKFPPNKEDLLRTEVHILQKVHHPGVVAFEQMLETADRIFVVMEKMQGDMLEMILSSEKGRLSERTTQFLVDQILVALSYLHSQNIVHCDLKPENILLTSTSDFPQVKLCDFGFARIIGERSFRRSVVGTPAYLAPEVLRNKGFNRSLDMWSVGVIVYVSLSGTFPFNEDEDIHDQIQNAEFMYPPAPWKEISDTAIDFINGLLQVKMSKRFSVSKALSHEWMQGYPLWSDLRLLENQVGERFLTHESDDKRWKEYEENNGFVPVYV
ncbi:hypothetical protein PENTCL1PPCAC_4243 [Pristionchus entomophagus]|uniref:protein kinase C n=1 Tax=Pristionchus entomophagus TaxID=358040 RepID=A0AAV5SG95_9BILA|nr:hypothetical protein PENTCL1PPCAC_4243 [Pristionchus entomophagus]